MVKYECERKWEKKRSGVRNNICLNEILLVNIFTC